MADYTRRTFKPKYVPQAEDYSSNVSTLQGKLTEAITELNNVENSLGLDPENAHDILTYNVIVGNNEIKEEITGLVDDLNFYTGEISTQAEVFDEEDRVEFEAAEDARIANLKAQEEKKNNETTSDTSTEG